MTKEELTNRARDFVCQLASGTPQEMEYFANILVEFANETTKELEKENAELCHSISEAGKACAMLNEKLTEAKNIIQDLLSNSDEYARQRAMDYLKEE